MKCEHDGSRIGVEATVISEEASDTTKEDEMDYSTYADYLANIEDDAYECAPPFVEWHW